MGAAFSLVGLLVTIALMFYLFTMHTAAIAPAAHEARDEASQIAGVDVDTGARAADSMTLTPDESTGHCTALVATAVSSGGVMAKHYGLQAGDRIVEIGPMRVRDMNDSGLAKSMADEAFQRQYDLVVERDGQPLTLTPHGPQQPVASTPAPAAPMTAKTPTAAPANPTPANAAPVASPVAAPSPHYNVWDQVHAIPGVPDAAK